MPSLKTLVRRLLLRAGYRVTRATLPNRFNAMPESMQLLRDRGFVPTVVIDGGANRGTWTGMARRVFPEARFHLIEPQPVCVEVLHRLAAGDPSLVVHPCAITLPGVSRVSLAGDTAVGGTGVAVVPAGSGWTPEIEVPAATLDDLIADDVTPADRVLLKLDLEGHEMQALEGASRVLPAVEVLLTEVQIYPINDNGGPTFADLLNRAGEHGFELHDIACLGARARDQRLCMADVILVRRDSSLATDRSWA